MPPKPKELLTASLISPSMAFSGTKRAVVSMILIDEIENSLGVNCIAILGELVNSDRGLQYVSCRGHLCGDWLTPLGRPWRSDLHRYKELFSVVFRGLF